MNIENQITELRILESQAKLNKYGDAQSAAISRRYRRAVSILSGSAELKTEADLEQIIAGFSEKLTVPVAESFGVAGSTAMNDTMAVLSWDGLYKDAKTPKAMSANQLKGLAMTEKIDGKLLTAHLDNGVGKSARRIITNARIEGKGISKMTSELWTALGGKESRRNLETISRTYIGTASSYAREMTYKQNDDVIKGYRLCATLENGNVLTGRGTCPRCAALDQQTYGKTEARPRTPFHPNCLCVFLPETLSWKELGFDVPEMQDSYRPWAERAGNRERVGFGTSKQSMSEFWTDKSEGWQNRLIGPRRAEMVRKGLIGFNDIVDKRTSELFTIKQLKSKIN